MREQVVRSASRLLQSGSAGAVLGAILVVFSVGAAAPARAVPAATGRTAGHPDVQRLVGPVAQNTNLRKLKQLPASTPILAHRLTRHPAGMAQGQPAVDRTPATPARSPFAKSPSPEIPSPTQTFAGMTSVNSGCSCLPPDTEGDVGPSDYIQSVNFSIRIHDKSGNVLAGPITYNSFFSALTGTPCGNTQNRGDGSVLYDHQANRWIVTDFAFPTFPGTSFWQCVGVSQTGDPVAGGWYLYAVQIDPANTSFLGDYPKLAVWRDAYYLSVNLFSNPTTFSGVRVFALDRSAMINGGPANTVAFTIAPADLGNQYSLLPATFRTGSPPPAGRPEWFMDVNSSAVAGTVETQVFVRRFHVDFATPANSTFGVGASHAPDGIVTVNGFVDAFTTTENIVPNGTATSSQFLDSLGDKLMFPLVYQNLGGTESIYADQTVNNNKNSTGPTAIRWYQFTMTGNSIPATPTQQQTFNNGGDGLWRWMPSLNVDSQGNLAIGYSTSSMTVDPGIRYAGRLAGDPASTLAQGEAVMTPGVGHQTSTSGRWGDYSATFVDPSDGCSFFHTNEYYSATSSAGWNTRVGSFKFPSCPLRTLTISKTGTGTGTVTSNPAGINCGATCTFKFANGTSVSLTPSPAAGSTFTGFSGDCSGASCTIMMSANRSVTATFTRQKHNLTVTKAGSGVGTVTSSPAGISCPSACASAYDYGTAVTLTPAPNPKSYFTGWSGDCAGKAPCVLSMTADHAATATFKAFCIVPKVVGKTLKKAKAKIKKAYCSVGKVTKKTSPASKKGKVLKQSPKAGKTLKNGAKVKLTVGKGP